MGVNEEDVNEGDGAAASLGSDVHGEDGRKSHCAGCNGG